MKSNGKIKTKKIKKHSWKKKDLWEKFDDEINPKNSLEMLWSQNKIRERDVCDLCNSPIKITDLKYSACSNPKCGVQYKDHLDQTAEWRYYGADDNNMKDPTRCGMPINPLLKESSFGCKVICHGRSTYEMRKIRRYTEWQSMPYEEKTQYDEFERIKSMAKIAGISKIIIDEALRQHKKISSMKTFRGCNRDGIIAASLYISCRIHNYPRTAKEIATIFYLDNTSSTRGCKNAVHILENLEENNENNEKTYFHQTVPTDFIERYCSRLNINYELTQVCKFVAHKIQEGNMMPENTPHSVAAGIIYFVAASCNLNITKRAVNKCSEISEVTINKCFKKLEKKKDKIIPSIILKKYSLC